MNSPIGLVVALPSEARTLLGPGPLQPMDGYGLRRLKVNSELDLILASAGVGIDAARIAAQGLITHGVSALVSVGLAGGLAPGIAAGHIILSSQLLQTDGRRVFGAWKPDAQGIEGAYRHLTARRIPVCRGTILTVAEAVLTHDAKAALFVKFRGLAVDMESAAVARVAAEAGLPFFGVRAICDPVERTVPNELAAFLDAGGKIRPGTIAMSLARRPALVVDMWGMGRLFSSARKALKHAWQVLVDDRFLQTIGSNAACSSAVSADVGPNP